MLTSERVSESFILLGLVCSKEEEEDGDGVRSVEGDGKNDVGGGAGICVGDTTENKSGG